MPSSHPILCRPLLLLPPIPPSIRVFSNESTLRMRWPKYWNFSFSIIPPKEHPALISFWMLRWVQLVFNPINGSLQAPLCMGFSRQEYWSGLPLPSPGDLPYTGIEYMSPVSPALQEDSLPLSHLESPCYYIMAKSQHSLYIPIVINNFILVRFLLRYLKSV